MGILNSIATVLDTIASAISHVFDVIVWLVDSIASVVSLSFQALYTTGYYFTQLPVLWLAPFTAIVTIAIIFKVKG